MVACRFHFGNEPDRRDSHCVWLGPHFINESNRTVERLAGQCPPPPSWASDLLQIARAVWLVDKITPRKRQQLGWTRDLELSIALREPETYVPCVDDLELLLQVLTGDRWTVSFTAGWSGEQGALDLGLQDVSEVALFSGGLDSTYYAASATHGQQRLLLVSYAHNERGMQNRVFHGLRKIDRNDRLVRMVQFRQLPKITDDVRERYALGAEYTSRSRGLLFVAAAVYAAAAYGVARVAVPENGQLAINAPLAPDRIGACCTRTAHPLSLHLINRIIGSVGGTVAVDNPLRDLSKAQVCLRARSAGVSDDLLSETVSCSKVTSSPSRQQHCGHCWACLVRRAALLHQDPTSYETNPWRATSSVVTEDLDALHYWLARPFGVPELAADIPIPDDVSLRRAARTRPVTSRNIRLQPGRPSINTHPHDPKSRQMRQQVPNTMIIAPRT